MLSLSNSWHVQNVDAELITCCDSPDSGVTCKFASVGVELNIYSK